MAESRTWAIITALAAQLATISTANGYNTDVGAHVWTTDAQRPSEDALGLMIYSESITGNSIDSAHPAKPVREFPLLIEAAIGTDQDDAQQQIHAIIEDIEACMEAYAAAQFAKPGTQVTPFTVTDITILDRPEGAAVVAMQARVVARYFR